MVNLIKIDHSFSIHDREKFLNDILKNDIKGILLNTCNRIEFYWGDKYIPEDITRHLFRVVSGLESKLIGENSIQNQVKKFYLKAKEKFELSKELHLLFQRALYVGKKVRNSTNISKGAISHSQLVVEKIKKDSQNLTSLNIVLIGVNKLNEDILKYLFKNNIKSVILTNRTIEKAIILSKIYNNIIPKPLSLLKDILKKCNILISATSAPHIIVKKEDIPNKDLTIFDLAVPRDVDPEIANNKHIKLYNIEDIESFFNFNIQQRKEEIIKAERIIEEEIIKFYQILKKRELICQK